MICMGNICRSPLAHGLFLHKINERGVAHRFEIDSCGTGDWHAGELPDSRARAVARKRGVNLASRARQVHARDFTQFDYLICMDETNREHLLRLGAPPHKLSLLLEHDPAAPMLEVPDPYSGPIDAFELVYRLVDSACDALIEKLLRAEQVDTG